MKRIPLSNQPVLRRDLFELTNEAEADLLNVGPLAILLNDYMVDGETLDADRQEGLAILTGQLCGIGLRLAVLFENLDELARTPA